MGFADVREGTQMIARQYKVVLEYYVRSESLEYYVSALLFCIRVRAGAAADGSTPLAVPQVPGHAP